MRKRPLRVRVCPLSCAYRAHVTRCPLCNADDPHGLVACPRRWLPQRHVSGGTPPEGLRNWLCSIDGHEDPEKAGECLHCGLAMEAVEEQGHP